MQHPKTQTLGVVQLNEIYADNVLDNQVWQEIVTGERKGMSVGGINEGRHVNIDPTTGKTRYVLENFAQTETSTVHNPANPFALNEAVSLVAKSCDGQVKEESEKACDNTQTKEEDKMSEDANKENVNKEEFVNKEDFNTLSSSVADIHKKLDALVTAKEEPKEEEPKEEKPKEEAEKEVDLNGDDTPEEPKPEEANQEDTFKEDLKKEMAETKKMISDLGKTMASTPRPGKVSEEVNKSRETVADLAMGLANGSKRATWSQVNKAVKEHNEKVKAESPALF